jgi:MFS family permease
VALLKKNEKRHDPYAVLRIKEFNFFLITRFFLTLGIQLQSVVVGWQIYELTHDVVSLGMIGLAEAIPFIIVSFFSGHVADTFNRKWIVLIFSALLFVVTLFLFYVSISPQTLLQAYGTLPIYAAVVTIGLIRDL